MEKEKAKVSSFRQEIEERVHSLTVNFMEVTRVQSYGEELLANGLQPKEVRGIIMQDVIEVARAGHLKSPEGHRKRSFDTVRDVASHIEAAKRLSISRFRLVDIKIPLDEQVSVCALACVSRSLHQLHRICKPDDPADDIRWQSIINTVDAVRQMIDLPFSGFDYESVAKNFIPKPSTWEEDFINGEANKLKRESVMAYEAINRKVLAKILEIIQQGDVESNWAESTNTLVNWLAIAERAGIDVITPELKIACAVFGGLTKARRLMYKNFIDGQQKSNEVIIPLPTTTEGEAYRKLILAREFIRDRIKLLVVK